MYSYIKGTLAYKDLNTAVIEAGGVGYEIFTPLNSLKKLPETGNEAMLFTHLNVKEDIMELYGFSSKEEKQLFETLISVSGVGPKAAIAILSAHTIENLINAIATGNAKEITKAQGIGPKIAARIVLELKDKLKGFNVLSQNENIVPEEDNDEAIEALIALGYSKSEAAKAVLGISGSVEEVVAKALRNLMRR